MLIFSSALDIKLPNATESVFVYWWPIVVCRWKQHGFGAQKLVSTEWRRAALVMCEGGEAEYFDRLFWMLTILLAQGIVLVEDYSFAYFSLEMTQIGACILWRSPECCHDIVSLVTAFYGIYHVTNL